MGKIISMLRKHLTIGSHQMYKCLLLSKFLGFHHSKITSKGYLNPIYPHEIAKNLIVGQPLKTKKGTKKAAVALARKVLCILHHLLMNREMYQENGKIKSKPVKFDRTSSLIQMSEQDMIDVLSNA